MSSNYVVEYAKSGRANCKGCNKPIANKALRLSVQSTKEPEEGERDHRRFTNNRHIECLTKAVVTNALKVHESVECFPGLDELQPEDQERVRDIVDRVLAGTWVAPEKAPSPVKAGGKRKSDEYDDGVDVTGGDTQKKAPAKKGGKKKTKKAASDDEDDC